MNENLEYVACPSSPCGGQWLPASKIQQLKESHATFYCPSGHSQWFTGKSKTEQLEARIKQLEQEVIVWRRRYEQAVDEGRAERRRQYALRGVITKLKKAS